MKLNTLATFAAIHLVMLLVTGGVLGSKGNSSSPEVTDFKMGNHLGSQDTSENDVNLHDDVSKDQLSHGSAGKSPMIDYEKAVRNHDREGKGLDVAEKDDGDVPEGQQYLEVAENSPYCLFSDSVMTCDFQWTKKTILVAAVLKSSKPLKELFLLKAQYVRLSRNICFDVILHHIANTITIEEPPISQCQNVMMRILNVTLNYLPYTVDSFHASSSTIHNLALNENVQDIFVDNSNIHLLSTISAESKAIVKLQNSYIARIEELKIVGESRILFKNCSIGDLPKKGMTIGTTGNILEFVTLPKDGGVTKEGIFLFHGSDLLIGDLRGTVNIMAQDCNMLEVCGKERKQDKDFNDQSKFQICPQNSDSHILLVFVIFSIFLNVFQFLFNQPKKFISKILCNYQKTLCREFSKEEGKRDEEPIESPQVQIHLSNHGFPTTILFNEENTTTESSQSKVPLLTSEHIGHDSPRQFKTHVRPSERLRKRSLQDHNFWKGHTQSQHLPCLSECVDISRKINSQLSTNQRKDIEEYPLMEKKSTEQTLLQRRGHVRKYSYAGPYGSTGNDFWLDVEKSNGEINKVFNDN